MNCSYNLITKGKRKSRSIPKKSSHCNALQNQPKPRKPRRHYHKPQYYTHWSCHHRLIPCTEMVTNTNAPLNSCTNTNAPMNSPNITIVVDWAWHVCFLSFPLNYAYRNKNCCNFLFRRQNKLACNRNAVSALSEKVGNRARQRIPKTLNFTFITFASRGSSALASFLLWLFLQSTCGHARIQIASSSVCGIWVTSLEACLEHLC